VKNNSRPRVWLKGMVPVQERRGVKENYVDWQRNAMSEDHTMKAETEPL